MASVKKHVPSLLNLCKAQLVRSRHHIGDISRAPIEAIDTALSAMTEKELRRVELKSEQASGHDMIAETWPLWYSIYVRRYGYDAAKTEPKITEDMDTLNGGAVLKFTERKKHTLRMGPSFEVPLGNWRHAVDWWVTQDEKKLRNLKIKLKQDDLKLQATLAASKPRKVLPKSAGKTLQQRAAVFKVKQAAMKRMKTQRPMTSIIKGNSKTGFKRR